MLTLMSVCGLVMTLLDYIIPKVVASVFSEDSWTSEKEKKLEQICQEMVSNYLYFFSLSFFFLVGAFFLSDKDFVCV